MKITKESLVRILISNVAALVVFTGLYYLGVEIFQIQMVAKYYFIPMAIVVLIISYEDYKILKDPVKN